MPSVEREKLAALYWMRVVNADAEDYDRIGWLKDIIDENGITYYVLRFKDETEQQFTADQIEYFYSS